MLNDKESSLLHSIVDNDMVVFPELDLDNGVRYPLVENILGVKMEDALSIIDDLSKGQYLVPEVVSKIFSCPKCESIAIILKIRCPYCNSDDLARDVSLKHYKCDYVGFRSEFVVDDGYRCPSCNKKLEKLGSDYRLLGTWYKCNNCGEKFGEPKDMFLCVKCDTEYEKEDLVIDKVYCYSPNKEKANEIMSKFDYKKIKLMLGENYDVEYPSYIKGNSGINHSFSMKLRRVGMISRTLYVDIYVNDEGIEPQKIMNYYAKIMDTNNQRNLIVACPKLSDFAENLAKTYHLKYIETEKIEEIVEFIMAMMESDIDE
ncbi:MAG TPA: hypothetical protein PK718_08320 [Candidatus Methanofastidiosa archaeon]|nr:hypothetical protein [Candidatus Methanofastidiosa archaeon]HPR42529.1 hypothetical protein [Candidatus Methanofastidiosa archaeon]